MMSLWGISASQRPPERQSRSERRALGAGERHQWSSLVRLEDIDIVRAYLTDPALHGAVILGPRGVGKTTLARKVARRLEKNSHVVRLFGAGVPTDVPYSIFSIQLARLNARQSESPSAILGALVDQIFQDAHGLPIVLILDDLPGVDTLSMGVLMHLVLGGKAKLLVAARSLADFPEDLVWMIKDGLLARQRLEPFSRAEVRELLSKALDGPVAESVVATLYAVSAGNPLVLQALVYEYLQSGVLRANDGVWIQVGSLDEGTEDVLLELVESRMARESPEMRTHLEKFSLLNHVPLALALNVLGAEAVTALEDRGFLVIAANRSKTVSFAEPYVGETVRNQLSAYQKASYFEDLSELQALDAALLSPQELLIFASWINEAGLAMEPEVALAAAQAALQLFDPQLALACASHIRPDHPLAVQAAQKRSRAHHLMANYAKAVDALDTISIPVLNALSPEAYASWAMDLTVSLACLPGTKFRINKILAETEARILQASPEERLSAEKFYNLARFEVHINRGEFAQVLHDLSIASKDAHDRSYRLNCACLLTMALAATGHELDAIELSRVVDEEAERYNIVLRMKEWRLFGSLLALVWSGQWRSCESALQQVIEYSNNSLRYRGGGMELALGMAYMFAGRDMQAAEILLIAAAQLEVRDTYTSSELVYSALACVHARLGDEEQGRRYLTLAKGSVRHSMWVNRTLSDYFQALATHAMGDPAAVGMLVTAAERDFAEGRPTPAASGLRAAIMCGAIGQHDLLEQVAQSCQGPLATISVLLARAARATPATGENGAQLAMDAAGQARALELPDLARHANELALELASAAGDKKLAREARNGMRGLERADVQEQVQGSGNVPLTPRELQVARHANKGMSNRDIAGKIGVSVRTVEGHLYQVFAKLGITSRSALEEWVHL
ncbi:LuxR C-terminal-related transcriptional regulator [Specibacter sp. NPDC078692]|uniref:LuxR C-terminal-related transcriptional regulator n=1 Tax=Specibacter sp. NPDC078692 TaxID=3155818 RepID=UPI00342793C7